MANKTIRIVIRNYDIITPLLTGDVVAEGIDLEFDRESSIGAFQSDASLDAGEMSFSGYLRQLDAGGTDVVGLPVFPMRGFRQRCFFVKRGSELASFKDLAGKRIGTNGWPDSGNTWSRSLLRAEGVDIEQIEWVVGPIDGVVDEAFGHRVSSAGLPAHARVAADGATLVGMLDAGDLDALMMPWPPQGFYEPDSPVVRLLPDFRRAEEEYARQVGFCPTHHILGVRTAVLEKDPWIAASLFNAFEQARELTDQRRLVLADTSPWVQADLEQAIELLGPGWQAHGIEGNEPVIDTFCEEMQAQGTISQRFDPQSAFARFLELIST